MIPIPPRLLVRASAVPFVPTGARLWGQEDAWVVVVHEGQGAWACNMIPKRATGLCRLDLLSDLWVDLSAPERRGGLPSRLDLLPWALQLLQVRLGFGGLLVADTVTSLPREGLLRVANGDYAIALLVPPGFSRETREQRAPRFTVDPWPNLDGLDEDKQARAIVAAALQMRGTP